MSDLADLFPGFASHWVDTEHGRFFARSGGSGPPLLLLHGYPQTHVEWHKVAARLAEHFTVVAMDLRGYGWSSLPEGENGAGMSKRALAQDAVDVMEKLGHVRFSLVGHDRGGRVAYRLAFDDPGRLEKLAVIDIVPTAAMFADMDRTEGALRKYHWLFLAQPAPFPETLIGASARYYLDHTLSSWTATKDLSSFDPRAMEHYRRAFDDPSRVHASCEDYRAGALIDRLLDQADLDAGVKIEVPLLAIWGDGGLPASGAAPLEIWRQYARDVEGAAIKSGHFVPEENPDACVEALLAFLR